MPRFFSKDMSLIYIYRRIHSNNIYIIEKPFSDVSNIKYQRDHRPLLLLTLDNTYVFFVIYLLIKDTLFCFHHFTFYYRCLSK